MKTTCLIVKIPSRSVQLMIGTTLSSALLFGQPAVAQQSASTATEASTSPNSSDIGLQDIVVTAQKREQNLRDVPASISALTGSALADQHVTSLDDVTRAIPGISFSAQSGSASSAGVGSETIQIRGIGSTHGAATVGVYVDDVPVTQNIESGSFSPMIFDLNRVEVLRGPQGTLFGASSEGGTVRYITNQPNLQDFSGLASAIISQTKRGGTNTDDSLVLNLPVVKDVLAVRVGGQILYNSGWIDQYANAPGTLLTRTNQIVKSDVNSEQDYAFRISATYEPDTTLKITPSFQIQRQHQNDTPVFYLNEGLYKQSQVVSAPATDRGIIGGLTIAKHFAGADLTSVTSYFNRDFRRQRDGTYFDSNYVVPYILDEDPRTASQASTADPTLGVLPVYATDRNNEKSFTQEVRLSSPGGSGAKFNWIVGAYFANTTDNNYHNEKAPGFNALFQSIYGFGINDPVRSPLSDPTDATIWNDDFYIYHIRNQDRQIAGFGQLDYEVLPRLRASAGLRYQNSRVTYSFSGKGYYNIGHPGIDGATTTSNALTPKVSLTYAVTPKINLYATAAKGYRDGGYNDPIPQAICAAYETKVPPTAYKPDKLWSYEAGFKGSLADGRVSLNADVYQINWSSIQQSIKIPHCGFHYTDNVGTARARGAEAELQVQIFRGLTFGATGSVQHATITSGAGGGAAPKGSNLLYTPQWTASANIAYRQPFTSNLSLMLRADNYWQGKSYGSFSSGGADFIQKAYSVLNASAGITTESGVQISVFAKNLLNDTTIIRSPVVADITEAYTLPPRVIGLEVKVKL